MTIEEHVAKILEVSGGDKQALIRRLVREIGLLHAALPAPACLEAIASHLEVVSTQEVELPDGTTFNAVVFLRRSGLSETSCARR